VITWRPGGPRSTFRGRPDAVVTSSLLIQSRGESLADLSNEAGLVAQVGSGVNFILEYYKTIA